MPVCLKCGYELVYGPAGCACTQAARHQRDMEEAARAGERLAKEFAPILEEARRVAALPPEEQARLKIQEDHKKIRDKLNEAHRAQFALFEELNDLQMSCKHPVGKLMYATEDFVCDDCGYLRSNS